MVEITTNIRVNINARKQRLQKLYYARGFISYDDGVRLRRFKRELNDAINALKYLDSVVDKILLRSP